VEKLWLRKLQSDEARNKGKTIRGTMGKKRKKDNEGSQFWHHRGPCLGDVGLWGKGGGFRRGKGGQPKPPKCVGPEGVRETRRWNEEWGRGENKLPTK